MNVLQTIPSTIYDPDRLRFLMDRASCDAVVACTRENIQFLAGINPVVRTLNPYSGVAWICVTKQSPEHLHFVYPIGEADQLTDVLGHVGETEFYGTFFRESGAISELSAEDERLRSFHLKYEKDLSPVKAITRLLSKLKLDNSRVAIDGDGVQSELLSKVKSNLEALDVSDGSRLLRAARQIKTSREVDLLAQSAQILEQAICVSASVSEIGSTELSIARTLEIELVKRGAHPSLTMLKIGSAAVGGQRRQRQDILRTVDNHIWFDCDSCFRGYWADIARICALESHRANFYDRFTALHIGQKEAIENVRPGMTGREVFDLTMKAVHRAGFPEYRRHHVGHGIGLEPYERPILSPTSNDKIEAGMVLSIETPYYEFGFGALHVEDPILVGETSNQRLTETSGDVILL